MKSTKFAQGLLFTTMMVLALVKIGYSQSATELQHFQSEVRGKTIAFDWSLADCGNIKAFGLERAGADLQFETIGTVLVRPTHRASSVFYFTDQQPLNGAAFYRLKIMDKAGNVQYCKVISQTLTASNTMGR